jgi:multicomponent Na+:H+ antiporter subunit B
LSRRLRLGLFALAGPGLAAVLVIGMRGLPAFGDYRGVYGRVVNSVELAERHATDVVTALNFDIRAFDTLGEEFILFASVAGVALLLRHMRDEDDEGSPATGADEHRFAKASDALRALSLVLVPLLVALGGYLILHGQLTPGGGFQGGVALAAGPLSILLAGRYLALKAVAPEWALEAVDSIGAAAYALIGLGGLIFASVYLKNFLPLGIPGHLLSAGMMPLNSLAVGIEVTGAFLLTWTEFLDQALVVRRQGGGG